MKSAVSWSTVPIKSVYQGLFDGPHATPKPATEGPVFLGIKNITDDGRLELSEIRHIAEDDFPKWTKRVVPRAGDIVFTYEGTLNRYAVIPDGFRGCLGRRLALIRPDPDRIDTRFLFYSFFGEGWRNTIARNTLSGATVDRIPLTAFPDFRLSVPPRAIQRKIASILSAYDDLIENNNRRIKILAEMAQMIYREWFVKFRFPGHEKVKMVDSRLGKIPEGWTPMPIGEVIVTLGGGTPSTTHPEYWENGNINWFTPSDLTSSGTMFIKESGRKITELGLQKSSARVFPAYSVMMTSRATIGVTAINTRPACTNQGFITCVPNESISTYQLYYWIAENKNQIMSVASGATYKEINRAEFREFPIIVSDPKTNAQFSTMIAPIAQEMETLLSKNTNLRQTRDLLLPKLISGEIDLPKLEEQVTQLKQE